MAIHKYAQFGRFSVITMLPFLVFVTVMFFISVKDDQAAAIILGIVGIILISMILFLGIFIPAVVIIHGGREPVLRADSKGLTIKSLYGESVMYSSITVLDSATCLPAIKRRTNGFAAGRILKGHFMLQDGKRVKLFVSKDSPPYINIQTAGTNIWLNFKDPEKTRSLYERLKKNN